MEPRKTEKPVESHGEGQTSPPRQPEQTPPRRFRIIKLEERIAPSNGGHNSHGGARTFCGCGYGI
jgi:hypothetical protein